MREVRIDRDKICRDAEIGDRDPNFRAILCAIGPNWLDDVVARRLFGGAWIRLRSGWSHRREL